MKKVINSERNFIYSETQSDFVFNIVKQIALVSGLIVVCFILTVHSQPCSNNRQNSGAGVCNGIGVSEPKVFDNRSLMIMLEELDRQLQSIRVIDQTTLNANLGLAQGAQSRDVARSLEFGTIPIPGVTTKQTLNGSGELTVSEQNTTQPGLAGKTPTLPDLITSPSYQPRFGINSEDLLTQQIDLTYKIFNLRMLLERSISDRLRTDVGSILRTIPSTSFVNDGGEIKVTATAHGFPTGLRGRFTSDGILPKGMSATDDYYIIRIDANTFKIAKSYEDALYGRAIRFDTNAGTGNHTFASEGGSGARLQTVVGLNVSLDPPKDSKDMAAFVELTVKTQDGKPVSVVALMPQEKTYNTSALSTKSNAFGGSAVFKVFTLGYSERRRGQTFYLYQDADTITYQKMPPTDKADLSGQSPTFGWQFRPVLGRRSVSPGMRQVFAVLSLDRSDTFDIKDLSKLNVEIKTYWRKYDRKTLTVYDDERNAKNFTSSASVPTTSRFQESLRPKVKNVSWFALDDKNGILSVEGENFFSGTNVLVGNSVFTNPTNGLIIKSDQSLQIRTTIDAFVGSEIVLNGRYGNSTAIVMPSKNPAVSGVVLYELSVAPISDKSSRIVLKLKNKSLNLLNSTQTESDNTAAMLKNTNLGNLTVDNIQSQQFPPFVLVKNTAFTAKDAMQEFGCKVQFFQNNGTLLTTDGAAVAADQSNTFFTKKCLMVIVDVPSALLKEDTAISFRIPLMGTDWFATKGLYFDSQATVKLVKAADITGVGSRYWISGTNLDKLTILPSGGITITPTVSTENFIEFQLTTDEIKIIKSIVLQKNSGERIVLELPDALPKGDPPKITETLPSQVFVNASKTIVFKGMNLKNAKQALFEGKELQIIKNTDTEITVLLTRDVTKSAGEVEILFKYDNNIFATGRIMILEAPK